MGHRPVSNIADKIADDAIRHAIDIEKVKAGLSRNVIRELNRLGDRAVRAIIDADPRTQRQLSSVISQLGDLTAAAYARIEGISRDEALELAEFESQQTLGMINKSIGVDMVTQLPSDEVIRRLADNTLIEGAPSAEWWSRMDTKTRKMFADEMRRSVFLGEGVGKMVQRIRGTRARNFRDGIMDISRRNAEALARTSVQAVMNAARFDAARRNSKIVKGVQWLSTLDLRTSHICQGLSNLQWDLEGNPIGHSHSWPGAPPAHWNCRSTLLPVLRTWSDMAGKDVPEPPPPVQATMDGKGARGLSYEQWLRTRPEEEQRQVLGATRYELWSKGKLSMRQMIDQRNEPLTVAELRAKAA